MASLTSRLKLRKPDRTDNINVVTDLNENFDKIDAFTHTVVCTSTTRPNSTTRFVGMQIFETDTRKVAICVDAGLGTWIYVNSPTDSGWVDPGPLATGWSASVNYPPRIRKVGNQVYLRGMLRYDSGSLYGVALITLPEGYRPTTDEVFLGAHKASGGHETVIGNLFVTLTGQIMVPTGYGGGTLPVGTHLPLNGMWFTD